ncbi:hypothetical protein, partial [Falsiroseomonas oryzae]|uniref:hypothetical protein n=1 Tax=Falsiroseomonas oryzae TaxID=2766473 RepID=UPI0022EA8F75
MDVLTATAPTSLPIAPGAADPAVPPGAFALLVAGLVATDGAEPMATDPEAVEDAAPAELPGWIAIAPTMTLPPAPPQPMMAQGATVAGSVVPTPAAAPPEAVPSIPTPHLPAPAPAHAARIAPTAPAIQPGPGAAPEP